MDLLFLSLLIGLLVLFRIQFIQDGNASDEWFTLWRMYRQKNRKLHYSVDDSVVDGFAGSPKLYYYILSKLNPKYWKISGDSLNIIWDVISVVIVYVILKLMLLHEAIQIPLETDGSIDLILVFVLLSYVTSPLLVPLNSRVQAIKARAFSLPVTLVALISLYMIIGLDQYMYSVLYVSAGIILILSSAFGAQYYIFISLFVSLAYLTLMPLILLIVTFALCYNKWSGGYYVIRHKLNHYKWYASNYAGTTANRNKWSDLFPLKNIIDDTKYLKKLFYSKNSFVILLYNLPVLPISLFFIYETVLLYHVNSELYYISVLVLSGLTIFIITSLPKFLFLGEAERYFEYLLFPVYFTYHLFVYMYADNDIIMHMILVVYNICVIMVSIQVSKGFEFTERYSKEESDKESNKRVIDFLKTHDKELKIMTIPFKMSFKYSSYLHQANKYKWYYMFISSDSIDGFEYMINDSIVYNVPTKNMSYYRDKYGINLIILSKSLAYEKMYKSIGMLDEYTEIYSDDIVVIYEDNSCI